MFTIVMFKVQQAILAIKKAPLAVLNEAFEGGAEWARTTDSRIFSPMLYQLSYSTAGKNVGQK